MNKLSKLGSVCVVICPWAEFIILSYGVAISLPTKGSFIFTQIPFHPTSTALTDDNVVVGVAADDLFDLLCGSLPGWQDPGGVTVGVVKVQEVYVDVVPEARLT